MRCGKMRVERGGSAGTFRAMGRAAPGRFLMLPRQPSSHPASCIWRLSSGIASIGPDDVMILPHDANPGRKKFSERTGFATPAGQPRSSSHSNQFEFITTSYVALEPRRVRELDRHCIVRRTLRRIADRESADDRIDLGR